MKHYQHLPPLIGLGGLSGLLMVLPLMWSMPVAIVLSLLVHLPLFYVAVTRGTADVLIAGVAGWAVLGLFALSANVTPILFNPLSAMYGIVYAAPALMLAWIARNKQYIVNGMPLLLVITSVIVSIILTIFMAPLMPDLQDSLKQVVSQMQANLTPDQSIVIEPRMIERAAKLLPGIMSFAWVLLIVSNIMLAGQLRKAITRQQTKWLFDAVKDWHLPLFVALIFIAAIFWQIFASQSDTVSLLNNITLGVSGVFAVLGLALCHRTFASKKAILWGIYILLFIIPHTLVLLIVAAMIEPLIRYYMKSSERRSL